MAGRKPKSLGVFKDSDTAQARLAKLERHRLECEARYWMDWIKREGYTRWEYQKERLSMKRGKESVAMLVDEMENQRQSLNEIRHLKNQRASVV